MVEIPVNLKLSAENYEKYKEDIVLYGTGVLLVKDDGSVSHVPLNHVIIEDKDDWYL